MADQIVETTEPTTAVGRVAGIRFQKLGKLYHFDCADFPELSTGDYVIVETVRGRQMGQVMGFAEKNTSEDREYKTILRIATARDMMLRQMWEERQVEALVAVEDVGHGAALHCTRGQGATMILMAPLAGSLNVAMAAAYSARPK